MILWMAAALAAYFIKGLCGFANTMIFSSILSFSSANADISPVEVLLSYPTNVIMVLNDRRHISWRVCLPLAALVLAGSVPGALLLKNVDARALKLVFGAMVALLGVEMLLRERLPGRMKPSRPLLAVIGVVSGALCGLFGVGALLAAYVSRVTDDVRAFRANLNVVFIVEATFRVILYAALGIINLAALKQAATLLPFMGAGLFLGIRSGRVINGETAKRLVTVLLILSGLFLIAGNLG